MSSIRFANVLLETNQRSLECPSMYCRANRPVFYRQEEQAWSLYGRGIFDFSTYFNALPVYKLKKYTRAKAFRLHLELLGASCSIAQTIGHVHSVRPEPLRDNVVKVSESEQWQNVDLDISCDDKTVVSGFVITTDGQVLLRSGYYEVEYDGEPTRVELAIATTTFKKEEYVKSNIELIKQSIFESDEPIADHLQLLVIDNGRTLDSNSLNDKHVTICPNDNVGGSGGFARGMIEALEQSVPATHVLLMDDDVAVSPESIKRTYALLQIVRSDYADAFISGAMLNYDVPDEQNEDVGFMTRDGHFSPIKEPMRLTQFENIVNNELFDSSRALSAEDLEDQMYAGWWFCCIPASQIRKHGMPLPLFVRTDDAEYALRCQPEFITMNGLCVWHVAFHTKYNAAVERYQTTRNTLVAQCTTGFAPKSDFLANIHDEIRLELKKFGYANAELCLDALEDFFKGPEFLSKPVGERCFMRANHAKEQLVPLGELEREAVKTIPGFDASLLNPQFLGTDIPRSRMQRIEDYVTDNHQRYIKDSGKGYAVIPAEGWVYPAGMIRDKNVLVVVDYYSQTGTIRVKDVKRYERIKKRYHRDMAFYRKNINRLRNEYRAAAVKWTSIPFWKHYLNM